MYYQSSIFTPKLQYSRQYGIKIIKNNNGTVETHTYTITAKAPK